jgi:sulfoxide reductase heme-binding subunit YedZ
MPLALGSVLVLVVFLTLPLFDASAYAHADIFTGPLPQERQRGEAGPMAHRSSQTMSADHGGEAGPMDHGGNQNRPMDHGGPDTSGGGRTRSALGVSIRGITVATGYIATGLLGLTLLIGPANLLLRRRNPVSSYLRRDVGTWTAIFSVVHVIYGLQVHGGGRLADFLTYFVAADGSLLTNSFGLANWTGLAATAIVVGLLALSSDLALRKLKAKTWKNLQRFNYALFALVIAHAFFYGAIARTDSPYTLLLLASAIVVIVGQTVGIWLWRRRHIRTR